VRWGDFFSCHATEENMLGFKDIAVMASAVALMTMQPGGRSGTTAFTFRATFKGVDGDGQTLVWSSDAPSPARSFVIHILPLGSAASSAESVWPVSATLVTRDSAGTPMESTLYGIIDWQGSTLRLHGDCERGAAAGSSVTASGTFTDLDVAGTLDVLPVTASR
jgi:hypothetical protein